MKAIFPGRFQRFDTMKPGDVCAYCGKDGSLELAMKAYYPEGRRDYAIRFVGPDGDKPSTVLLSQSTSSMREHTLLVLENLEISPTETHNFVGLIELDQRPIRPSWLGLAGTKAFLTFAVEEPGPVRTGR